MNYVNRKTGYFEAFESLSSRKRNTEARSHDLIACIFGSGANYSLHRLASSSDRSISVLRAVNDYYIIPETTGAANDLISNALPNFPFSAITPSMNPPRLAVSMGRSMRAVLIHSKPGTQKNICVKEKEFRP